MRWRSGLMASVLMGTFLSEVDDTSILRKRHTARHHWSLKYSLCFQKSRPPQQAIAQRFSVRSTPVIENCEPNFRKGWIALKKSLDRSFRVGAGAFLKKPPYLAGAHTRIGSGQRGIKRDSGDELCQLPQILGGRCKQEFVASAAWSSQPQSSEPQNPLKMRK
jgi:hypothetical protein